MVGLEGLHKLDKLNDHIGTRIRDFLTCSIAPQPYVLPRAAKKAREYLKAELSTFT
jgi:hypothetical protein